MTTLAPSFYIRSSLFLQAGSLWGKSCDYSSTFIFDELFFILAGNKHNYKISDGFEIRQDQTRDL